VNDFYGLMPAKIISFQPGQVEKNPNRDNVAKRYKASYMDGEKVLIDQHQTV
jgi:hypothetical protein